MNQFSNLSAENSIHALAQVASDEVASDTPCIASHNARKAYRANTIASRKPSAIEKAFDRNDKRDFAVSVAPAFRKLWKQIQRECAPIIAGQVAAVDTLMSM